MVRPRYEVFAQSGRQRMAHVNVERTDLEPDPKLAELGPYMGKGHILPAPVLPLDRFDSVILPTPMARGITHFPLKAIVFDASGEAIAEHRFGNLPRDHASVLDVSTLLAEREKGCLPAMATPNSFTISRRAGKPTAGCTGFSAIETGSAATPRKAPSAATCSIPRWSIRTSRRVTPGRPPGLTTRLFLRIGQKPYDTLCHLIYPASTPWRAKSDTALILMSNQGQEIAQAHAAIPCSGSYHWRVSETFEARALEAAGEGAYAVIRDATCRLFGYHGLVCGDESFSLDHMFGF